jgi:hypothetical protein
MRKIVLACLAGWLSLGAASQASAQYTPPPTSPFYRPPISPYLNLTRPGQAGINYYGLVRPQIDTYATLNQLQYQQNQLQAGLAYDQNMVAMDTGHSTRFGNYSHYFSNRGGSGSPVRIPSAATPPMRQAPMRPPSGGTGTLTPPQGGLPR